VTVTRSSHGVGDLDVARLRRTIDREAGPRAA